MQKCTYGKAGVFPTLDHPNGPVFAIPHPVLWMLHWYQHTPSGLKALPCLSLDPAPLPLL